MIRKSNYLLTLSIVLIITSATPLLCQSIPERPNPPRLVNDLAGMLNAQEVNSLEMKLVAFNDSTTTQISIVTVPTLDGTDVSDYAQKLGEKWGIGQKGKDNGVLILVKPKTSDSKGYVKIAQGYGLEGALPDITCAEIVDYEIIPAFKNGDIYGGLNNATNIIMSLVRHEFTAADYGNSKKKAGKGIPIGPILIGIFILISVISGASKGGNNRNISSGGLPFWMLLGMMNSGRGHGGSWGGFSGGGSSGGFGGFGGGSFGGGGASGSW